MINGYIYKIENIENNKFYIGSTNNYERRTTYHKAELESKCHHNAHLQNAYNKYGKEKFEFIILETFENIKRRDLYFIEQEYIDKLNPSYNISRKVIQENDSSNKKERILKFLSKHKINFDKEMLDFNIYTFYDYCVDCAIMDEQTYESMRLYAEKEIGINGGDDFFKYRMTTLNEKCLYGCQFADFENDQCLAGEGYRYVGRKNCKVRNEDLSSFHIHKKDKYGYDLE